MLPLLSARPVATFPAEEHHHPSTGTKLYCLVTEAHMCEQLAQGCYAALFRWELNPPPYHCTTAPPHYNNCKKAHFFFLLLLLLLTLSSYVKLHKINHNFMKDDSCTWLCDWSIDQLMFEGTATVRYWCCDWRTLPQPHHVQTTSADECNAVLSDWQLSFGRTQRDPVCLSDGC